MTLSSTDLETEIESLGKRVEKTRVPNVWVKGFIKYQSAQPDAASGRKKQTHPKATLAKASEGRKCSVASYGTTSNAPVVIYPGMIP